MQLLKIGDEGELVKINKLDFEDNNVYLVDDDERNTIFIWVGNNVDQSKKDATADVARKLDKEHGGSAKILIMKQKREYGSFLAMMENLKKGQIPGKTVERRPEFVFRTPPETIKSIGLDGIPEKREISTEERILQWFQQIKTHRKEISIKSTDTIKFIKFDHPEPTEKTTIKISEEPEVVIEEQEEPDFKEYIQEAAYFLSLKGYDYDQLCWILAENILKINMEMPSIEDIRKKAEQVFNSSCTYDELCWLISELEILIKKNYVEKKKKYGF